MKQILLVLGLCFSISTQAAIVITSQDQGQGQTRTQYFGDGRFLATENGQPLFGIEKDGTCWFVAEGRRITDSCKKMAGGMQGVQEKMLSGLSAEERAMMQQMGMFGAAQAPQIKEVAGQRIAGIDGNRCYEIGGPSHQICINESLQEKIKREMGSDFFVDMQTRFQEMANMAGSGELSAIIELSQRGFVMKDVQAATAIPGLNPAMLQLLPPEQREQIMAEMPGAGMSGGGMQGEVVTAVDEGGAFPALDLSAYPSIGFDEFVQQMMSGMGTAR